MNLRTNLTGALLAVALPFAAFTATPAYSEKTDEAPAPAAQAAHTPDVKVEADDTQARQAPAPDPLVRDTLVRDVTSSREVLSYKKDIEAIESDEGAYADRLSESLLSLGLKLQAQGRHDEAIKAFHRGVHLARINQGLYCTAQIPLLQAEIASYVAAKNYTAADERQAYLYRVQTHSVASGDDLAAAYMQQAKWQRDAFELGVGQDGYTRLMQMSDLYHLAAQDVIAREGDKSPKLLAPLYGMLQAQYLISSYDVAMPLPTLEEQPYIDESLIRFKSYRADSYQQGNTIIKAISTINQNQATPDNKASAESKVMLGDWRLWNGQIDAALDAYREAEAEIKSSADAQTLAPQFFGEPVALPNLGDLSPLPPVVAPENADVTLAFGVNERGRVEDVERVDTNAAEDRQAIQLMKQLRRTTFRPRFEDGQPVETQKLVKAFNLN
jgi:hypothetical protein